MSQYNPTQTVLLLGMVYANNWAEHDAEFGQVYRDGSRCWALEQAGYTVCTLDDKHHDQQNFPNHCCANFTDVRRMLQSMCERWDGKLFSHLMLDYFMSPVRLQDAPL